MSTPEQAQARLAAALDRLARAAQRAGVPAVSAASAEEMEALKARLAGADAEIARLRQVNMAVATKLEQTIERIEDAIGESAPA